MTPIQERLEHLRSQIRAERISYQELSELQDLADHIKPDDVELLEWAGVPDFEVECSECGHDHFSPRFRRYSRCPLKDEGCTCPMGPENHGL